jgi:predicted GIY-YIG superfamily endonuclease
MRVTEHQAGLGPDYTRERLPVTLVWYQQFGTRVEAQEAERRIKGWSRAKKMALIRDDWHSISKLAKGKDGPSTSSGKGVPSPNGVFEF